MNIYVLINKNNKECKIMIKEVERVKSVDGSSKYLFNDGKSEKGNFEALYFYPGDENVSKSSICMSTQVGCGVGCAFCATGKLGLKRNFTILAWSKSAPFLLIEKFTETLQMGCHHYAKKCTLYSERA